MYSNPVHVSECGDSRNTCKYNAYFSRKKGRKRERKFAVLSNYIFCMFVSLRAKPLHNMLARSSKREN